MSTAKPFIIPKTMVMEAFKAVKANAGAAGIDQESLDQFEQRLKDNLYKLWNRMSSGSYMPPPVKSVPIPKKSGGHRILGIPTVTDRIAQATVKLAFEPCVEPHFLPDSYGYRPNKSALDAVGITRQRCWKYNWVLEYDVKGLFDNIRHDLLLKAVQKHTTCNWVLLYIERWLRAPMQTSDGTLIKRDKGTPQGGVISPVLANLFLHYVFDLWMTKHFPYLKWCRYADDGLVHCRSEKEAIEIKAALENRFGECGLELHPQKTKIVHCKDVVRRQSYPNMSFDFLGYTFRPRRVRNPKTGELFCGFSPAISNVAAKGIRAEIRKFRNRVDYNLEDIANLYNPKLRGWMAYYGRFYPSAMYSIYRHFNLTLVAWAMDKFGSLRRRRKRASRFLLGIATKNPRLFHHWSKNMMGTFA